MIWWRVSDNCELARMGVFKGDVSPQKLENVVFLQLESCNLVNTFRHRFKAGDE